VINAILLILPTRSTSAIFYVFCTKFERCEVWFCNKITMST